MTPYAALGVCRATPDAEIKAAYRKLCQQVHPDKPHGSEVAFNAATTFYEQIKDAKARERYFKNNTLRGFVPCHRCRAKGQQTKRSGLTSPPVVEICDYCDGCGQVKHGLHTG